MNRVLMIHTHSASYVMSHFINKSFQAVSLVEFLEYPDIYFRALCA